MVLEDLEPKIVWDIFENVITSTPRCSQHEELIRKKIKEWVFEQNKVLKRKLEINEDAVGNLFIKKSASKGKESVSSILLQAHLDMVCETDLKSGFDFSQRGIPLRIQENKTWIDAEGTSLGADDGIGLAIALAILIQDDDSSGPIEALFTVNEEDGFTGANNLDPHKFGIKSKYMINLDGGPLGDIVIGSVCGRRVYLTKEFEKQDESSGEDLTYIRLEVEGLMGGHSGGDIDKPRANANKLISRMLSFVIEFLDIYICKWDGGLKGNAIPRSSIIQFAIKKSDMDKFKAIMKEQVDAIKGYYHNMENTKILEPDLNIKWQSTRSQSYLSNQASKEIITLAHILPNGVIRMSPFFKNFVETSCNLGTVSTSDRKITFFCYPRSISKPELNDLVLRLVHIAKMNDWSVELRPILPEWTPKPKSKFLRYAREQYESVLGDAVNTSVIHGGLETGMINEKIPELEMISLGPTIEDLHSPSERLKISDVGILFHVLTKIINNFSILK
jgi:dipeptidase D